MQLQIEIAPVGQPGQAVLIGFSAQRFTACGLFGKQCLELADHLVHGVDHPAKLGGFRQFRQAEEFAAGDGIRLLDHIIQRPQLALEQ